MTLLLALVACLTAEPPSGGACASCHGDPTGEGEAALAPPVALGGLTDPAVVGAHQAHLLSPVLQDPLACSECHLVPAAIEAPGHLDTPWPAEVAWGELTKTGGLTVPWDHATGTCTVYCHGTTLTGGALGTPAWAEPTRTTCGACHGNPPPPPHPESSPGGGCDGCHGAFTVEGHLDGVVDLEGATGPDTSDTDPGGTPAGCDGCHGANGGAAPPPDLAGNTSTDERGVGAHDAHVTGTGAARVVPCDTCHVVPAATADPDHMDGGLAEVIFSGLATNGFLAPTYDVVALTCSDTWCHGATLPGGTVGAPVWTLVDGTASACDACHGAPPAPPHPSAPSGCSPCHDNAGPGFTFTDPDRHVDGFLDL